MFYRKHWKYLQCLLRVHFCCVCVLSGFLDSWPGSKEAQQTTSATSSLRSTPTNLPLPLSTLSPKWWWAPRNDDLLLRGKINFFFSTPEDISFHAFDFCLFSFPLFLWLCIVCVYSMDMCMCMRVHGCACACGVCFWEGFGCWQTGTEEVLGGGVVVWRALRRWAEPWPLGWVTIIKKGQRRLCWSQRAFSFPKGIWKSEFQREDREDLRLGFLDWSTKDKAVRMNICNYWGVHFFVK